MSYSQARTEKKIHRLVNELVDALSIHIDHMAFGNWEGDEGSDDFSREYLVIHNLLKVHTTEFATHEALEWDDDSDACCAFHELGW